MKKKKELLTSLLCSFFLLLDLTAASVQAATRTVDTTSDNSALTACTAAANDCSLRGAVSGAASGDTINFDASLNGSTITVGSVIALTKSITISGPGADKLTLSGGGTTRLFNYFGSSNLTINFSGLTISGGNGIGGNNANQGGAIQINGGTTNATFDGIVFSDNSASQIGGVLLFLGGVCRITNSTVINNFAPQATVFHSPVGSVQITNSTFSGNSGDFGINYYTQSLIVRNSTIINNPGGGLYRNGGTLTLANSIVAGNGDYDLYPAAGTINTNGGNLIGNNLNAGANFPAGMPNANGDYVGTYANPINPLLTPLANYGGSTPTYAILSNSPALNNGNNCVLNNSCSPAMSAALINDQRGAARQTGAAVDSGAFERNITIDQTTLPNGNQGFAYNQQLSASRSTNFAEDLPTTKIAVSSDSESNPGNFQLASFTFSVISIAGQQFPPGLSLASDGTISGTPTMSGTYTFTVKATDTDGMAGVQQFTLQIAAAPTAASVTISGRTMTSTGRGISNVLIRLTSADGSVRLATTTTFGYYRFTDVQAGETYIITAKGKHFEFSQPVRVLNLNEDAAEVNFVANPN